MTNGDGGGGEGLAEVGGEVGGAVDTVMADDGDAAGCGTGGGRVVGNG